ncbi:MAG TPA: hypothetical protein VGE52_05070 [Pirellulales bacterium]
MNGKSYAAAAALCLAIVASVYADALHGGSCGGCSNCHQVQKVCRVVCEMKEVKETKYKVECEDFCVPCHSKKVGCKEIPVCGDVRTRKKLVKYEEVKKVPHYKCVVKYLCPTCCHQHGFKAVPANLPKLADGDDVPAEMIPTLAEKLDPAGSPTLDSDATVAPGLEAPIVKPVSNRLFK